MAALIFGFFMVCEDCIYPLAETVSTAATGSLGCLPYPKSNTYLKALAHGMLRQARSFVFAFLAV